MNDAKWWLVCYDVHDPSRLRRCASVMEGSGQRMQHSVFRCWMTPAQMHRLRWELTQVLEPDDEVLLIPLCPRWRLRHGDDPLGQERPGLAKLPRRCSDRLSDVPTRLSRINRRLPPLRLTLDPSPRAGADCRSFSMRTMHDSTDHLSSS